MFNFVKNFFSKPQPEEEETYGKIIYYIDAEKNMKVDITIPEYNSESIAVLARIINTISSSQCALETIETVKNSLHNNDQQELLVEFLLQITKFSPLVNNVSKSGPCIKPSDML